MYGCFLKQLSRPTVKAVKHPSVIKKVDYAKLVTELWSTPISDNSSEDQSLKKTIANCSCGMLEKQINKKVKSKILTPTRTPSSSSSSTAATSPS